MIEIQLCFDSCRQAEICQKQNNMTTRLDQYFHNTHMKTRQRTNFSSLESSWLLTKIWAINSNAIVWGFPIFSRAALSNKLISCGELGMFLVCPPTPTPTAIPLYTQTHKYRPSSPGGINQRQHCQVLRSCVCASLFILENGLFLFQFH